MIGIFLLPAVCLGCYMVESNNGCNFHNHIKL